ncbi:hypothetical protein T492DRAFT_893492 [Pavlovales sp. CCMP2436]|nr:hypothetical protein T492DRAFT_893492 [Pavlovales sp. CCMP2436]
MMQDEPTEDGDEEPYDERPLARLGVRTGLSEWQLTAVLTEVARMIHDDPSCLALDGEDDIEIAVNFSDSVRGFGLLAYELGHFNVLRQLDVNFDAEDAANAAKKAAKNAANAAAAAKARREAKLLAQVERSSIEPPSAEQLRDDDAWRAQLAIDATVCETLRQQAVVPAAITQTRHAKAAIAAFVCERNLRATLRAAGVPEQRAAAALLERAHDGAGLLRDLVTAASTFGGAPTPALSPAAAAHAACTFDVQTYITYTAVFGRSPPRSLLMLLSVATLTSVLRGAGLDTHMRGTPGRGKHTRTTRPAVVEASKPARRVALVDGLELLAPIVARLRALRRAEGLATDPAVPRLSARRAVLSARAAIRRLELPPTQNPNLARAPVKSPTVLSGVGVAGLRVLIAVRRPHVAVSASMREDRRALATVLLDDKKAERMIARARHKARKPPAAGKGSGARGKGRKRKRTVEETFLDGRGRGRPRKAKGAAPAESAAEEDTGARKPSKPAAVNDSGEGDAISIAVIVHDLRPKRRQQTILARSESEADLLGRLIGDEPCEEWRTVRRVHDVAGIELAYSKTLTGSQRSNAQHKPTLTCPLDEVSDDEKGTVLTEAM